MENVLNFIVDNWVAVSGVILWLAARLVKTEKNYDLIEGIIKFIGSNVIPNRRKSNDPVDNADYKPGKNNTPNNILRLVVLYVMFGGLLSVLPLQSSLAQLNGNFKTVRFVNVITPTDTANVLPINATIYYNEVTNKLMAYENGQWKELIRSGGGGITTASNGLNVVGSDVRLGGTLTENLTNVELTNTGGLFVDNSSSNPFGANGSGIYGGAFDVSTDFNGVFTANDAATGTQLINLDAATGFLTAFAMSNTGFRVESDRPTFEGITYLNDYSSSYTNRSLVDKEYVDNAVNSAAVGDVNEVQTSDGAGGFVASNLFFDETTGAMTLGDGSLAGDTRNIIAAGSTSATNIEINPVGNTAQLYVQNSTDPLTTFTIGRTLAAGENSSMSVNGNSTTNTTTIGIANLGDDASLTMLGDQHTYTRYSKSGLAQRYVTGLDGVANTFKLGFQNAASPTPATATSLITLDGANIWVIMPNLPTVSPCGSAPSGTLWNNSGVINICP